MTQLASPRRGRFLAYRIKAMDRAIPIENFYYLLCYAYDQLPDKELTKIDSENCPDSFNLLALALARSFRALARKGLETQYLEKTEETPRLRGRVLVHESRRRMIDRQARMLCRFDELSVDCLPNRILRSTCDLLLHSRGLTSPVRKELRTVRQIFSAVRSIHVTESMCARVRIHRNNRRYRLPIGVCRLILRSLSPLERTGKNEFFDTLMEEKTMARVFESFVRNFARIHLPSVKVGARKIDWEGEIEEEARAVIPIMQTDVTLESKEEKRIIDCKFYKEAMTSYYGGEKVRSSHLYQLTAYLRNASVMPGWENVTGQLLYPAVKHNLNLSFSLNSFPIKVSSVDLDQPWQSIEKQLLDLLRN